MSQNWAQILRKGCPTGAANIIAGFAISLPDVVEKYAINTRLRQAHFLAQCSFESAHLQTTTEYGTGAEYNGRHDLGNVHAGDGPRFKGRGLIQITGRANYGTYGKELGRDFVDNPTLLATFPFAALASAMFWRDRNINHAADRDDVREVTRLINGGENGLYEREHLLTQFKRALA